MNLVLFSILLKYYIKIYLPIRKSSKGLSLCPPVNILSAHSILNKPDYSAFFLMGGNDMNPRKGRERQNGAN